MLIVPITPPLLLCVNLATSHKPIGCLRLVKVFPVGQHLGLLQHPLMHSDIRFGEAEHVWRAVHAFGSMLNTALANALLLVTELCFWYQLAHVRHEGTESPVGSGDSQANETGGNSTSADLQQSAFQLSLPRIQNASRYPLPWIVPLLPVFILWLQSLLFVNYKFTYLRNIDKTVIKISFWNSI